MEFLLCEENISVYCRSNTLGRAIANKLTCSHIQSLYKCSYIFTFPQLDISTLLGVIVYLQMHINSSSKQLKLNLVDERTIGAFWIVRVDFHMQIVIKTRKKVKSACIFSFLISSRRFVLNFTWILSIV